MTASRAVQLFKYQELRHSRLLATWPRNKESLRSPAGRRGDYDRNGLQMGTMLKIFLNIPNIILRKIAHFYVRMN